MKKTKLAGHTGKPLNPVVWNYFERRNIDGIQHAVCKNCPVIFGDYVNSKYGKYRLDTADPSKSIEYHLRVAHPVLHYQYSKEGAKYRWKRIK